MAFTNETKNTAVYSFGHSALQQENEDFLLTEDGFKILLEPETGPRDDAAVTFTRETKNTA